MKLVNVVQRQRYKKDITSMIKEIAPELLGDKEAILKAIDRMHHIGAISRQEKTYVETRLQAKIICLMIEKLFREQGYEAFATVNLIEKYNKKPGTLGKLVHVSGPHLPEEYIEMIDGLDLTAFTGACGRAAATNKIVSTPDAQQDPLYEDFWGLLQKYNLHGVSSFPIHVEGEVAGVLAVFSCERLDVPAEFLESIQEQIMALECVWAVIQEKWKNPDVLSWKFIIDQNGTLYYLEEEAEQAIGWTYTDVIHTDCKSYVHPDEVEDLTAGMQIVFDEHKLKRSVWRCRTKNGDYKPIDCIFMPITDSDGLRFVEVFVSFNSKACIEFEKKLKRKIPPFPKIKGLTMGILAIKMFEHLEEVLAGLPDIL